MTFLPLFFGESSQAGTSVIPGHGKQKKNNCFRNLPRKTSNFHSRAEKKNVNPLDQIFLEFYSGYSIVNLSDSLCL